MLDGGLIRVIVFVLTFFLISLFFIDFDTNIEYRRPKPIAGFDIRQNFNNENNVILNRNVSFDIWVSMGLCLSENTKNYGKSKYPYAQITPMTVVLWKHFTNAKILVYLIMANEKPNSVMVDYANKLKDVGAHVQWMQSGNLSCVLLSQLSRLFAFENPNIKENDVIIQSDVNSFIMNSRILDPIYSNPDHDAWIYQYYDSAKVTTGRGETFPMSFLSARKNIWRKILDKSPDIDPASWVKNKVEEINLSKNFTWYYDQWIATYGLLKHKICTVPKFSGLWTNKGLQYDDNFSDDKTCYHGFGYGDCNQDIHIVYQGCKWWHFFPQQTFKEHVKKFNELTNNYYNITITNPYGDDR